jgi:hypothetical protein
LNSTASARSSCCAQCPNCINLCCDDSVCGEPAGVGCIGGTPDGGCYYSCGESGQVSFWCRDYCQN